MITSFLFLKITRERYGSAHGKGVSVSTTGPRMISPRTGMIRVMRNQLQSMASYTSWRIIWVHYGSLQARRGWIGLTLKQNYLFITEREGGKATSQQTHSIPCMRIPKTECGLEPRPG